MKLREVSVLLKKLSQNDDSKSSENMPKLIALSKRMKSAVARMKTIAATDDTATAPEPPKKIAPVLPSKNDVPLLLGVEEPDVAEYDRAKVGFMMKKGDKGPIKKWKKRWFALRESRLYYYKAESDSVPINFIDMKGAFVQEPGDPCKQNDFGQAFQLIVDKRTYNLKCLSADDAESWLAALNGATLEYNKVVKERSLRLSAPTQLSSSRRSSMRITEKATPTLPAKEKETAEQPKEIEKVEQKKEIEQEKQQTETKEQPKETEEQPKEIETQPNEKSAPVENKRDLERKMALEERAKRAESKPVSQSVVGAWPSFEVTPKNTTPAEVTAQRKATAAIATQQQENKEQQNKQQNKQRQQQQQDQVESNKAIEKLEQELTASERALTKERLAVAAAEEQVRVLTLERDQMREEFQPLIDRLSAMESENLKLSSSVAASVSKVSQQEATIEQLRESLEQARRAQADSQQLAAKLTNRVKALSAPLKKQTKKESKRAHEEELEREREASLAHQQQCQFLEAELRRVKQEAAAQVQASVGALHEARAKEATLLAKYQEARNCSIVLSKEDFVQRLEDELATVRKELFFSLATGTKLQCALRGESCNLAIATLYEKVQIDAVAVKDWPNWIAAEVEKSAR